MKIERIFNRASLLVLGELEYEKKLTHDKFEDIQRLIAKCVKLFYVLGTSGRKIEDCKKLLDEFDASATVDEILEKVVGKEEKYDP